MCVCDSEIISLFEELKGGLEGFWSDSISIDKLLIERNLCPECRKNLAYKAFSNSTTYKAFGICEACQFAKLFWTNTVETVKSKKRFSSVRRKKRRVIKI